MGINLYNKEGYVDPTAYEALNNIVHEEKKKIKGSKCFALKEGKCTALNIKECENCSFYKTIQQAKEECEKALKQIKSLEKDIREYILCKYYGVKDSI